MENSTIIKSRATQTCLARVLELEKYGAKSLKWQAIQDLWDSAYKAGFVDGEFSKYEKMNTK